MENRQKIKQAYKDIAVVGRALPLSLKRIGDQAGLSLEEVRAEFPLTVEIQREIWEDYLRTTLEALEASPEFAEYLVREKLLGFYFTFFELLADDREFVLLFKDQLGVWNYNPEFLSSFKPAFLEFVSMLLAEGAATEEVAERMILGNEYPGWHWPQMLFLLNGWVNDTSSGYTKTDQAIEKSVNLGFDIMGRNLFDSAFDFMKFVVTQR